MLHVPACHITADWHLVWPLRVKHSPMACTDLLKLILSLYINLFCVMVISKFWWMYCFSFFAPTVLSETTNVSGTALVLPIFFSTEDEQHAYIENCRIDNGAKGKNVKKISFIQIILYALKHVCLFIFCLMFSIMNLKWAKVTWFLRFCNNLILLFSL